jgi:phospholipase/carboxylesterase
MAVLIRTGFRLALLGLWFVCGCNAAPSQRTPASQPSSAHANSTLVSTPTPAPVAPSADYREPDARGWGEAAGLRFLEIVHGTTDPEAALPLVIVIHGLGDQPSRDWLSVIDVGAAARLVLPQAPSPYGSGFAWFEYDAARQDPEQLAQGIRSASGKLARLIEVLSARRPTRGRSLVTGFSQGGMLSYALALSRPELIAFAMPISGMLPEPLWPAKPKPTGYYYPVMHALHGDEDRIVPLSADQQLQNALHTRGYPAQLEVYPGAGHAITLEMVQTIRVTLTREVLALER